MKEHLDYIGEADNFHAAQRDDDGGRGQRVHAEREVKARYAAHGNGAQVQDRGQVHDHVQRQPENGHDHGHRAVVALVQELRHREDFILQVHRDEERGHDDERDGSHPLVGRDGQADFEARAGHAHELLGRDVAGNQRGADGPPRERALGQEVVFGVAFNGAVVARLAVINPDAAAGDY